MNTNYASADRSGKDILQQQKVLFQENKLIEEITNAISSALVILNENRQIVFMNELFSQIANKKDLDEILGQRAGEALECIYANVKEGGCGTSDFCKNCGAVNSILIAQKGIQNVSECFINAKNNKAFDLEVRSKPFEYNGEKFTIFNIKDISDRHQRSMLEKLFFHDVLNSVGSISGLSEVLTETENLEDCQKFAKVIHSNAEYLMNEISSHRQLFSAEKGELQTEFNLTSSIKVLNQIFELYSKHQITNNKQVVISKLAENFEFITDLTVLNRVIGNMTKNAIEASAPNSIVTVHAQLVENKPTFSVHNLGKIPYEIQVQIFKRSFTTKESGRGIGTYSMKLFGEKFLKGKVWFESDQKQGTTFYIQLPATN